MEVNKEQYISLRDFPKGEQHEKLKELLTLFAGLSSMTGRMTSHIRAKKHWDEEPGAADDGLKGRHHQGLV